MSFAVRSIIARNARINGVNINLESRAYAFALKSREVTDRDVSRVTLSMAIDEHMHPTWHSMQAWIWREGESPERLPKTTIKMKEFVRDYKGWGD